MLFFGRGGGELFGEVDDVVEFGVDEMLQMIACVRKKEIALVFGMVQLKE